MEAAAAEAGLVSASTCRLRIGRQCELRRFRRASKEHAEGTHLGRLGLGLVLSRLLERLGHLLAEADLANPVLERLAAKHLREELARVGHLLLAAGLAHGRLAAVLVVHDARVGVREDAASGR